MMSWRNACSLVAAVFAATLGMVPAASADTKLTIMVFQGMQNLPLLAAQEKGLFAKHGLTVEIKIAPNSDEQRAGLADGRFQIIHSAVDNGVAMADVAKVDIAAVIGGDNGFNQVIVQPDINTFGDLRGKTVIVDALNTAYAFQLYAILNKNGLAKSDYTIKPVGATFKRLDAITHDKELKASMLNPPFSIRAEKSGLKSLGSAVKILGPYQATAGIVRRDWAKANPETLVHYLQAYIEGLRWSLDPANKAEAVKLLADGLKLPPDIAERTYAIAADPAEGLAKDARFDVPGFKNVLAMRAAFEGGMPSPPEAYIDLSYYERALAGL
jgi:ABC-type nitrate/sulfonate/bicarbonate transport system substrate-binding protein